ncbi:hypothetical protein NDU88_005883 [Pleurodeles waltl]|uniref:Uncharacterized protein n=1 Tax=Pleurodeles waltl TaxID=8319 RepID=A0AAV7WCB6_PLEWA|nr:hypothetical protein NDU88_005883 [Pleurodeles waltl]
MKTARRSILLPPPFCTAIISNMAPARVPEIRSKAVTSKVLRVRDTLDTNEETADPTRRPLGNVSWDEDKERSKMGTTESLQYRGEKRTLDARFQVSGSEHEFLNDERSFRVQHAA